MIRNLPLSKSPSAHVQSTKAEVLEAALRGLLSAVAGEHTAGVTASALLSVLPPRPLRSWCSSC